MPMVLKPVELPEKGAWLEEIIGRLTKNLSKIFSGECKVLYPEWVGRNKK
jgi:hypothetical protein